MITPELITQVAARFYALGTSEEAVKALRADYRGLHFTYCADDDVTADYPVYRQPEFNIYLVNGHEHCLTLTPNFETATGVVLAWRSGDDEE